METIQSAKGLNQGLKDSSCSAIEAIQEADKLGRAWMARIGGNDSKDQAAKAYEAAFKMCREVLKADKLAFQVSLELAGLKW
jgi:hypothetical protein